MGRCGQARGKLPSKKDMMRHIIEVEQRTVFLETLVTAIVAQHGELDVGPGATETAESDGVFFKVEMDEETNVVTISLTKEEGSSEQDRNTTVEAGDGVVVRSEDVAPELHSVPCGDDASGAQDAAIV